jgi:hypothetical protein
MTRNVVFFVISEKETCDFSAKLLGLWAETFDENTQHHIMKMSSSGEWKEVLTVQIIAAAGSCQTLFFKCQKTLHMYGISYNSLKD